MVPSLEGCGSLFACVKGLRVCLGFLSGPKVSMCFFCVVLGGQSIRDFKVGFYTNLGR